MPVNLDVSFVTVGPGVSALAMFLALMPNRGRRATKSTMMPMPPSHWVSDLHRSTARGRASTSSMTVAPVVVKPEHVSKNAS